MDRIVCNQIFSQDSMTFDRAAILLAITPDRTSELYLKESLSSSGYLCGSTEVSGKADDVKKKLFHNIVGASLNLGVINKDARHIHALVHAAHEACTSINFDSWLNSNYLLKIAIVRKEHWLAVAFYGQVAAHPISNHNRMGLGIMHV